MRTDTDETQTQEPDLETTMDGGLCRLEAPSLPEADDEKDVAPAPRPGRVAQAATGSSSRSSR
jgi:hypothetical protein